MRIKIKEISSMSELDKLISELAATARNTREAVRKAKEETRQLAVSWDLDRRSWPMPPVCCLYQYGGTTGR